MVEILIGLILLWILSPSDKEIKNQDKEDVQMFFFEEFHDKEKRD